MCVILSSSYFSFLTIILKGVSISRKFMEDYILLLVLHSFVGVILKVE